MILDPDLLYTTTTLKTLNNNKLGCISTHFNPSYFIIHQFARETRGFSRQEINSFTLGQKSFY